MDIRVPKVSVIVPSYNHSKFIGKAIESILNQSYKDLELIIVDDCSPDNSVEVIKKIKDSRVSFYQNSENQGAVFTTNFGIKQAKGKYIALLNSDDTWDLEKLSKQVEFMENNPTVGAVFSDALFINEFGKELDKVSYFWADVFKQENRSSALWLKRFFFQFNCICHPSILIRREIYNNTKLYDSALRQLPDFSMWVDMLKFINIHIMEEKLVIFRILANNDNASADTVTNRIRTRNEILLIMRKFFENMTKETFQEGFKEFTINKAELSDDEFRVEQAFMYLNMNSEVTYIYKLIALEKFHDLLNHDATRQILREGYNFTEKDFFKMTADYELIDSSQNTISNIVIESARKHLENKQVTYNFMKNIYKRIFRKNKE